MRSKFILPFACAFAALASSPETIARERLFAQCATAPADIQGRKECNTPWRGIKAGDGYYFDRQTLKEVRVHITGGGSCDFKQSRWVEIGPGQRKPTRFSIRAAATSFSGIGEIGTTICEYTIETVAYE